MPKMFVEVEYVQNPQMSEHDQRVDILTGMFHLPDCQVSHVAGLDANDMDDVLDSGYVAYDGNVVNADTMAQVRALAVQEGNQDVLAMLDILTLAKG